MVQVIVYETIQKLNVTMIEVISVFPCNVNTYELLVK